MAAITKRLGVTPILLAMFATVTVMNLTAVVSTLHVLEGLVPPPIQYSYVGEDFPAQLPFKLPSAGLVMQTGKPYFALDADDEWGSLFPASDGFVEIGPKNRTFLLSIGHQLHCLDAIRVGFLTNSTGSAQHIQHCLRYLRQFVICQADTTLEVDHPRVIDGQLTHEASGLGSVHRCKDWTVLRDYMEEHGSGPVSV